MFSRLALFALAAAFLLAANFSPALAARYYADQTDLTESSVPLAEYRWDQDDIDGCIYKEDGIENSYYVWTKMAVQKWRQALREYTGNQEAWGFTARYVRSQAELESCDVKFYIYDTYRDFPDYPAQTGAYTSVTFRSGNGDLDARVYLAPLVLHGDGETEIDLPSYAFRNSAVHEVGHVLGLGHMQSQKGYLMSPQFDFFEEDDQLPVTTLELDALEGAYGDDGFSNASHNSFENSSVQNSEISWQFDFDSKQWQASGVPPECPEPLSFPAPVDVNLASAIIYPGQIRGGDYKPHGGFRFDDLGSNSVDVHAPIDAGLFKAAKHLESGEMQYSLYFINDCGIMYKLDHLLELTDKFKEMLNVIPIGEEGDSRTTEIRPVHFITKGEHIATKVGFELNRNIFIDFGVYDLRDTNGVNYDPDFLAKYPSIDEYGAYAVCWIDYLEEKDNSIVQSLPASGTEGKTSDYCK